METRIKRTGNKQLKEVVENIQKDGWKQTTQLIKEEIGITNEDIVESTYKSKRKVRKKTMEYFKKTIEKEGKDKSKVQYLLEGKSEWKPGKRPEYMNKLTRNQVNLVFQARTRMIKVKENYLKKRTKEPHMQSMYNRGRNTAAHTRRMC